MSDTILERLPDDGLSSYAAMEQFGIEQAHALGNVAKAIERARTDHEEAGALIELAERVYVGEFLRDAESAASVALDLANGAGVLDLSSFEPGTDEAQVREYLAPFQVQDPSVKYPFPRLWLPATAVLPFRGKEYRFDRLGFNRPLTPYYAAPTFAPDLQLPQLVDPQPRTFAEFAELSKLDPGHAGQVLEAYRMAAHEQRHNHPGLHFKDPVIIRAVATLPVGENYMTDFLPRVELADKDAVWDPRLLVGGSLNPAGNYLHTDINFARDRVSYSADGREAALRVSRPKPGERDIERDMAIVPKADHEYHSMAVILFPYKQEKAPRSPIPALGGLSLGDEKGMMSYSGGSAAPRTATVGDASIGAGGTGYFSADKRDTNHLGDRMVPVVGGQPLIYSIRLLTASAA